MAQWYYENVRFDDATHSAQEDIAPAKDSLSGLRAIREAWPNHEEVREERSGFRAWQKERRQQEELEDRRQWCIQEACVLASALRAQFRELARREVSNLKAAYSSYSQP